MFSDRGDRMAYNKPRTAHQIAPAANRHTLGRNRSQKTSLGEAERASRSLSGNQEVVADALRGGGTSGTRRERRPFRGLHTHDGVGSPTGAVALCTHPD